MSNITTVRSKIGTLSLTSLKEKDYTFYYFFQEVLKNILEKKGIVVLTCSFNKFGLSDFLDLVLYYRTKNLLRYKKKLKKYDTNTDLLSNNLNINLLLSKYDSKRNFIYIKITNYNKKVSPKRVAVLYISFKKFFKALFSRRFNLFLDFIKITTLFLRFDKPNFSFLQALCQIFRILTKRHHSKYILFLQYVFNEITSHFNNEAILIKGLKLVLSGKIKGKLRSSVVNIVSGSVPINTISLDVSFYKMHCYTFYGVFGFKFWVNREKINAIRTV